MRLCNISNIVCKCFQCKLNLFFISCFSILTRISFFYLQVSLNIILQCNCTQYFNTMLLGNMLNKFQCPTISCIFPKTLLIILYFSKNTFDYPVFFQKHFWLSCIFPKTLLIILYFSKNTFDYPAMSYNFMQFCCTISCVHHGYCWILLVLQCNLHLR